MFNLSILEPLKIISPLSCNKLPEIILNKVLFPAPLGPIIPTHSLFSILILTFFKTSLAPKFLEILFSEEIIPIFIPGALRAPEKNVS